MNFVMPKQISLNVIGDVEISTVKLNSAAVAGDQYETCVFYESGKSNVVARYPTRERAIQGHNRLVQHEFSHSVAKIQQEIG
jgi:hypothetical protein